MNKTLISITLIALSSIAIALTSQEKESQEQENIKMLEAMGLPAPGSGIKIVPRDSFNLSEEELAKGRREDEEIEKNGYYNTFSQQAFDLLHIHQQKIPTVKNIPLAFKITKPAFIKQFIGEVPSGGFHEDKGGWSGLVQFFTIENLGTCSYTLMDVKTSNTAAQLAQEDIKYLVHNKPTLTHIEGSPQSGFIHEIKWYDRKAFHELQCANKKFIAENLDKIINLALRLDKTT